MDKDRSTEMDRLIETMRGIVGALNAGHGDGISVVERLTRLETSMGHLERTLSNVQKTLLGLAVSVITILVNMLMTGVFHK
jgi:hypothetical protein